jgi:predicted dehydrogenase
MPKKVRVGVIGVGAIGPAHIEGFQQVKGAEVAAVCDLDAGRAQGAAQQFGIKHVYTDYRKLLAAEVVDAVSVCTPNNTHMAITIAALGAGKHVLCEKPIALNGRQARRMVEAAKRARRLLMTAQSMRYSGNARFLKRIAESGRLGEIYYAKGIMFRRAGIPRGWFQDKKQSGGGPIVDLGVHLLDLMWWVMGTPKPVSAFGVTYDHLGRSGQGMGTWGVNYRPGKFSVEDLGVALVRFADGRAAGFEVSWASHTADMFLLRLLGTKGGAQLFPDLVLYEMEDGTRVDVTPRPARVEGYAGETEHFVSCLRSGRTPISPGSQSVVVMDMLDAIYKSARTGKAVAVGAI